MSGKHGEQLLTVIACNGGLKAQMTNATSQLIKVEMSLHVSVLKERMAMVEVRTPGVQRCNVAGHLHTLPSKMSGSKTQVVEDIEDRFSAFRRRLAASLSKLSAAGQTGCL